MAEEFKYTLNFESKASGTGAEKVVRSLDEIGTELEQLQAGYKAAAVGSNEFTATGARLKEVSAEMDKAADAAQQFGTGKNGGRRGNAGMAALEFSRAFEDAQYGVRGVLNNIPGLVAQLGGTAGLAGVISIAAVAGTQLWERMSKGPKAAKNATQDYLDLFAELADVYKQIEDAGKDSRADAEQAASDRLKNDMQSITGAASGDAARASLNALKIRSEAQLALLRARNELVSIEQALVVATGEKAKQLAKDREAIIINIYDTEVRISDLKRKEALDAAQGKFAAAGNVKSALQGAAAADQVALAQLTAEEAEMVRKANDAYQARMQKLQELDAAIEIAREQAMAAGTPVDGGADPGRELETLRQQRESVAANIRPEQELIAQADAKQTELNELAAAARASYEANIEASRAMADAAREMVNIRERNEVERGTEGQIKAETGIAELGGQVSEAIRAAISQIQGSGAASFPGAASEALGRLEGLATDSTPDGAQGGQLAGILQSLANNLTAKDQTLVGGIDRLITLAKSSASRYEDIMDRIDAVEAQINQGGRK